MHVSCRLFKQEQLIQIEIQYLGRINSDAVVQRYFIKITILKNLENFQKNTCGEILF